MDSAEPQVIQEEIGPDEPAAMGVCLMDHEAPVPRHKQR